MKEHPSPYDRTDGASTYATIVSGPIMLRKSGVWSSSATLYWAAVIRIVPGSTPRIFSNCSTVTIAFPTGCTPPRASTRG